MTKEEQKAYHTKWRKEHPEKWAVYKAKQRAKDPGAQARYMAKFKARDVEWLREQKSKPCLDCGQKYHPVCMDFDHRDPATKTANVAHLIGQGIDRLKEEIAKCDLVCANCHRIRTWLNQ